MFSFSSSAFIIRKKVVLDPAPKNPDLDVGLAPIPSKELNEETYGKEDSFVEEGAGVTKLDRETTELDLEKDDFGEDSGEIAW